MSCDGCYEELTVIATDTDEKARFSGVIFRLEKADIGYTEILTTGQNGSATFSPLCPCAGDYLLSEDVRTTVKGYACPNPVALSLDSEGKIISVNGRNCDEDGVSTGVGRVFDNDFHVFAVYHDSALMQTKKPNPSLFKRAKYVAVIVLLLGTAAVLTALSQSCSRGNINHRNKLRR